MVVLAFTPIRDLGDMCLGWEDPSISNSVRLVARVTAPRLGRFHIKWHVVLFQGRARKGSSTQLRTSA